MRGEKMGQRRRGLSPSSPCQGFPFSSSLNSKQVERWVVLYHFNAPELVHVEGLFVSLVRNEVVVLFESN